MNAKPKLTARQRYTLKLLRRYIAQHGYAPSLRELSRQLGTCELGARVHLVALRDKGYVTWLAGKRHSLRIIGAELPIVTQPGIRAKLTARQRQLLDIVERYTREHGCPPAHVDVALELGVSTNAVREILASLRRKRRVTWVPARGRTLRVLSPRAAAA